MSNIYADKRGGKLQVGRTDLISAWLDQKGTKALRFLQSLYEQHRGGGALLEAEGVQSIREAVDNWLETADVSDIHRKKSKSQWNVMLADWTGATLADAPRILEAERERCLKAGTARTFAKSRAAMQALLRDMTDIYEREELEAHLKPDAVRNFGRHTVSALHRFGAVPLK